MERQDELKLAHELFVSGHKGTSPLNIILTVLPIVPGAAIASTFTLKRDLNFYSFCLEYFICIIPVILTFTICSDIALEVNAIMFLCLLLRITFQNKMILLKNNKKEFGRIPYLTASRATVNITTVIAILAVDFHIFPRRFAKTEAFGYSLMDVGAACFLFMNGITDSKKKVSNRNTLRSMGILIALGFLRLLSVTSTNYQEHVTEYGVHCNFFFTLAAIKILCLAWVSVVSDKIRYLVIICLAIGHEIGLRAGLQKWTLSETSERDGLLSANKEWFVSLPGNVLIYIIGTAYGGLLFSDQRKNLKRFYWFVIPLMPMLICFLLKTIIEAEPSRRLANASFSSWIVGFFTFYLTLFRVTGSFVENSCYIFQSVNSYSLLFFLAGNLLTGLINLSVNTLQVNNINAFIIINIYTFLLCYLVYYLYTKNVKLKSK